MWTFILVATFLCFLLPQFQCQMSDDQRERDVPTTSYISSVYYPSWDTYGRDYQPASLPIEKLTHVLYPFANVDPKTGEVLLSDTYATLQKHFPGDTWSESGVNVYGCAKQLFLLKKRRRNLRTLLSIGGWTYGSNFTAGVTSPNGTKTFAESSLDLIKDLGFDGLDLDWEYPEDRTQAAVFVKLLQDVRSSLDEYAKSVVGQPKLVLTVAAPAGPNHYQQLDIKAMDPLVDYWNLMAYDYAGSWDKIAGHQANLFASKSDPSSTPFCTDTAVKYYIAQGVPARKLILGMPLYGRGFSNTTGPGTSFDGVGPGTWEVGVWDYKKLPLPGAKLEYDIDAVASWSYDRAGQQMMSFDTPAVAERKAEYIKNNGLGGAFWWEINGDKTSSDGSLIDTVTQCLANLDLGQNTLNYPASRYDNLRAGFSEM